MCLSLFALQLVNCFSFSHVSTTCFNLNSISDFLGVVSLPSAVINSFADSSNQSTSLRLKTTSASNSVSRRRNTSSGSETLTDRFSKRLSILSHQLRNLSCLKEEQLLLIKFELFTFQLVQFILYKTIHKYKFSIYTFI